MADLIAATGAASFATLGKLVPLNGGTQEYLRFPYGDLAGFLFAWMWIFISRPLGLAMVSLIFSEYLFRALLPEQAIPIWVFKLSAILAVGAVTWLNCMGTRIGTGMGNTFLGLKIFGLGSTAVAGLCVFAFSSNTSPEPALEILQRIGLTTTCNGISDHRANRQVSEYLLVALSKQSSLLRIPYGVWESVNTYQTLAPGVP